MRLFISLAFAFLAAFSVPVQAYFFNIPVDISLRSGTPYTEVEIEGEVYYVLVDLGSRFPLSLRKDILEKLDKSPYGTAKWRDVFGVGYEEPAYIIPKIIVGDMIFDNIIANEKEFNLVYSPDGNLTCSETDGVLGRAILSRFNLLLDFSKSIIFATDVYCYLGTMGYHLEKFVKIPFKRPDGGIIFPIDLDIGTVQFALDTGCTMSVLDSSLVSDKELDIGPFSFPIYKSSRFRMGDFDFGGTELHCLNIFKSEVLNGILGMDFLKTHVVYIDFDEQFIYISKNAETKEKSAI